MAKQDTFPGWVLDLDTCRHRQFGYTGSGTMEACVRRGGTR